ncbi:hypothetical protein TSAR_004841 [Trichomalopsis sarcophagae]|uniref:F-box domain-containing protein n=1 Tax=Trichomalopsis sarcophagae TaxID=543379 RepID=A0A232FNW5_9HYME|nr:hypothetical protein TSAR_004841 [Trichomalopsis sarcophagae]
MEVISPSTPGFDILKELPLEIAHSILLKFDPDDSLLNCALVSYKWLKIRKSSKVLRKRISNHIHRVNRKSTLENSRQMPLLTSFKKSSSYYTSRI